MPLSRRLARAVRVAGEAIALGPAMWSELLRPRAAATRHYWPMPRHFPLKPAHRDVRPLPYPFQGAIAISSDPDWQSFAYFDALTEFLCTRRTTRLGTGLGLGFGGSLFFFSAHRESFAYFDGPAADAPPGPHAARLDAYLAAGLIDTNHAYGDFDRVGGFTRAHAERTVELLTRAGVRLDVYVNHGDEANAQNIGPGYTHHFGDVPGHPAYHADLLARQGIRWVWPTGRFLNEPLKRAHAGFPQWLETRRGYPATMFEPVTLQDGSRFGGVHRFRGTGENAPNLSSLGNQIDQIDFDAFYRARSVCVLYQHLGVRDRVGRKLAAASIEAMLAAPELYIAPFRRLAQEQDRGRLWVPGTGRLLRYANVVANAVPRVDAATGRINLDLPPDIVPAHDLAGLTIYIDTAKTPSLFCGDTEIALRMNGPDETGRYSATVPVPATPDIW
jgi:hypothetical protein